MNSGEGFAGNADIASAVGAILSNPAAMSMLSSLISSARAPSADVKEEAPPHPEPEPALPASVGTFSMPSRSVGGGPSDRRRELLCALKPFVSRSRCETIDHLIGILSLLDIAGPLLKGR